MKPTFRVLLGFLLFVGSACSSSTQNVGNSGDAASSADGSESPTTAAATTTMIAPQPPLTAPTHTSASVDTNGSSAGGTGGVAITQPAQPTAGPGSSAVPHASWRESSGGTGADAWYVFEPTGPQPASAPVTIIMHGYYEFDGYGSLAGLIEHTVMTGSIVIYPRWQTGTAKPCPGPFDIEPCIASATTAIHDAIDFLVADPTRVQPELDQASYFGFSFGGIITLNLANRYVEFDLPEPRAIFLDDPHDGALTGTDEPAVDDSLAGIPASTLLVCHVGSDGVIARAGQKNSSCNAFFDKLDHLPTANKSLVMTSPDSHGEPALRSDHGVCSNRGGLDAYDWNFCWKTWDALRSAALNPGMASSALALGTTLSWDLGSWSDGTPIAPLTVRTAAPIGS